MKYLKESSKRKSSVIFVVAILAILAVIVGVLLVHMHRREDLSPSSLPFTSDQQSGPSENGQELSDNDNVSITDSESPSAFEEEALESVMADGIAISTPIGELYYSKVWAEYTEVKYSSDEKNFTAVIQATIGEHKVDILAIHLSDESDGVEIGSVPDSDGNQRKVYLELYEVDTDNGWSQSEIDTVYAMQEGINQLIEQVTQLYGFIPA